MQNKWQMRANPAECRLCYMCQLVCSLQKNNTFNPSKAYVKLSSVIRPGGELDIDVSFTDQCDNCGLCVKYCLSGALSRQKLPVGQVTS